MTSGYALRSSTRIPITRSGGNLPVANISRSQRKRKSVKLKEDFEDIKFRERPQSEIKARRFAREVLSYLREEGCNLELVKPGLSEGGTITGGALYHLNFKAMPAADPTSLVETFFAQVRWLRGPTSGLEDMVVDCCVSLGESDSLPKKRDNRGCLFCSKYVHHPVGGCEGINIGWPDLEAIEQEQQAILELEQQWV